MWVALADPDLELGGWGRAERRRFCFAYPGGFSSSCDFFFVV